MVLNTSFKNEELKWLTAVSYQTVISFYPESDNSLWQTHVALANIKHLLANDRVCRVSNMLKDITGISVYQMPIALDLAQVI